jgi:hypothetical protein
MHIKDRRLLVGKVFGVMLMGACLVLTAYGVVSPARAEHPALPIYEGSRTCGSTASGCHHADKPLEVHGSVHYQWQGPTPGVPNLGGKLAGKWGSINDFCTYPNINFLFQMTNLVGTPLVTGCGNCHVGRGIPPSPTPTQEQLDNIDCLMCHSDLYKRVGAMVNGQPRFINDPNMDVAAATAAITKTPSRATCLTRCHVSAGGGPGFKQGDIDPAQLDPPRTLDVHMASDGAGLSCLDCHKVTNHHFAGRGNDVRPTESSVQMDCSTSTCHVAHSHTSADINRHMTRVHCTVCHIPAFGRSAPTDVFRDFTKTEADATNKYEPVRTFATNVKPAYTWFNGLSYFYEFGTPITLQSLGRYLMAYPLGDINDSSAKIHAFKLHQAKVGYDLGARRQIPVKSKVLWETGNVDQALRQGAAEVGWNIPGYSFATAQRYFSLYHEVAPKENALQCAACHVNTGQLDFKALGYLVKTTRNGKALCASCHSARTADFYTLHNEHVRGDEPVSCTTCHTFKTAPLLPRGGINGAYLLLDN